MLSVQMFRKAFLRLIVEAGLLVAFVVSGFVIYDYATQVPFSSPEWKAGRKSFDKIQKRDRMTADLLRRYKLIGMTRSQVIDLLGEPDQEGNLNGWHIGYTTGYSLIDPVWFVMRFDESNRVAQYSTDEVFG